VIVEALNLQCQAVARSGPDEHHPIVSGQVPRLHLKGHPMHTRIAGAVALLATGLLGGAFLYGRAIVVPTFASTPLDVHLAFRVELMKNNAVVMQALMAAAITASGWFALTVHGRTRAASACAAALALTSLLVTRFGNVPINLEIKEWAKGALPPNHPARLHTWDVLNDVRTAAALGAFTALIVAADLSRRGRPGAASDRGKRPDGEPSSPAPRTPGHLHAPHPVGAQAPLPRDRRA
jgi:uncharacterized membrane protein